MSLGRPFSFCEPGKRSKALFEMDEKKSWERVNKQKSERQTDKLVAAFLYFAVRTSVYISFIHLNIFLTNRQKDIYDYRVVFP